MNIFNDVSSITKLCVNILFQQHKPLTNEMVSRLALLSLFLVSVNASLAEPTNILPTLPNAIIKSDNLKCREDSLYLQMGLKNMTLWAQQSKFYKKLFFFIV